MVCLRSCLVGLAVAARTLGLEMGSLSFCFRLFSLSTATETVSEARAEKSRQARGDVLTCSSWFPHHVWFLAERNGRPSRRACNRQTFSCSHPAAASRCSSLKDTKTLLLPRPKPLRKQRDASRPPLRRRFAEPLEVVNHTTRRLCYPSDSGVFWSAHSFRINTAKALTSAAAPFSS